MNVHYVTCSVGFEIFSSVINWLSLSSCHKHRAHLSHKNASAALSLMTNLQVQHSTKAGSLPNELVRSKIEKSATFWP